ncbi:undecaprenyl-diphosphatase [Methylomarinovum caldicuralii]|uniref:Undecaprenyl-diphosphatase n=1 Tax=Methylomarinovum caldicuralii TaxID=438856 RepID=A0AAU9C0S6_9GAMM|nr:undecaprenyl-diphosphate phosphatase [Methylomarinovum caldicuralii]BCX82285.1 undecaprenyl-diphosphatase [Methylomarinovum caldicuralii]
MTCAHAFWLALLQGLTEFLPISSSAHLILVPRLLGWADQGLAFDVAVHVGTLIAVLAYFRHEVAVIALDWLQALKTRRSNPNAVVGWGVLIGTVPVGLAGLLLKDWIEAYLRTPQVIAAATIVFGLLLGIAERWHRGRRSLEQLTWRDAMIVGVFQAVALIPGTSRSGITITGALFLGYDRLSAARFSFLLSIPVILLAGGVKTLDLLQSGGAVNWDLLLLGVATSALAAYGCIGWFLRLLERVGMMPFVFYRLLLGGALLYFFWPSST